MKFVSLCAALAMLAASPSMSATLNGTGLTTSEVIFGSGNANGSWTGATGGSIEVGLRAKLRYDALGNPQNIFNYDGDRTYTFNPTLSDIPVGKSVFNFEFSVNSDIDGTLNRNVNDIDWGLAVDVNPTAGTFFGYSGDMIDVAFADHSFGDNSTAQGGGVEATDPADYALLRASNNVAQNSYNLSGLLDPNGPGIYTIMLFGSNSAGVLASTHIDIVVAPTAVPLPASLPLMVVGLGGLVALRRRKRA